MGFRNLGRPNWESTQLTSIGKGLLNSPYKVWLIPCQIQEENNLCQILFQINSQSSSQ